MNLNCIVQEPNRNVQLTTFKVFSRKETLIETPEGVEKKLWLTSTIGCAKGMKELISPPRNPIAFRVNQRKKHTTEAGDSINRKARPILMNKGPTAACQRYLPEVR